MELNPRIFSLIMLSYSLISCYQNHSYLNIVGKTTTAAMLSYVLGAMGDDLIAVVGANVPQVCSPTSTFSETCLYWEY